MTDFSFFVYLNMKKILLFLFLAVTGGLKAQYFHVTGVVADSSHAPIPEVSIYLYNGAAVGKTNSLGQYFIELRSGEYELVFSHPHYQRVQLKVVLNGKNDTMNLVLPELVKTIGQVNISTKWQDPGPEMMRKAIEKRQYWLERYPTHSAQLYIRAYEQYNKPQPRKRKNKKNTENDSLYSETEPTDQGGSMAEILLTRDVQPPDKLKEIRDGVSIRGDRSGLFYLSTTEGEINLYQNLVKVLSLSEMPVLSPLASTALLSYKFSFLGSYKDDLGRRILKISMEPRAISNSVFKGEIHLIDSLYCIYRAELEFPQHQLNEYNRFFINQEYQLSKDSFWTLKNQRFDYYARAGKGKFSGYTLVNYSHYELHKKFPKGHFGLEISRSADSAYDRDSSYWSNNRKTPLNTQEIRYITRSDSIKRVLNSEWYLDSMEKVTNKVTMRKLFLEGQDFQRRKKGVEIGFQPLMFIWQPWFPGGSRINVWTVVSKEFQNKRNINFIENLSYGLNNKDIRGTVIVNSLYNPFKRASISLSVGRDFGWINPNAAFLDLARRNNFYQNSHATASHRQELINGLFLNIRGEFSDRKDISGFKFDKYADSLFPDNSPAVFKSHRAFFANIRLSYTPFQQYIREPKQKVILGSKWPTFSISYRKAIPGIFGSTIDYDYLEYGIDHDFRWGVLGRSELRGVSGSFLNQKNVSLIDYRYQRRGDFIFFTPPMYAFQMLDSTFVTFKRFYEVHYRHHFNGALINKIPFMKVLGLRESAGINILYAPERRNMLYYEFYAGFDKLIKIWRERFKLGIYYTGGYSNIFEKPVFGFKFNFEYYDRRDNSW